VRPTLDEIRARTYKEKDAWWTVWLVDPVAAHLVRLVAPYRWITPNRITALAFALGLGAAAAFAQRTAWWLVAGAVLFHVSFVVDCVDGKIARLNGTGSLFGMWLDFVLDRVKALLCAVALFGGQFARTGDLVYLVAGGAVIFLDLFRYVNSSQLGKVYAVIHAEGNPPPAAPRGLRAGLLRRRVRPHLVSGIEFEMFVFIVGPLTGLVIPVTAAAGALLLFFELVLIARLLRAARRYERRSQHPVQQRHVGDRLEPGLGVQL
jgi:phosphatidylglycerophosphate synthase